MSDRRSRRQMGDRSEMSGEVRRRGGQQAASSSSTSSTTSSSTPPCGACKFLRRKCTSGCIFAPYFGTDQGAARFAAVHKVFGASNVSKLLTHIPTARRHDAVVTISYEAQARLSDPVYGCVSTILALQHQVANLQAELSIVQSQLINSRVAVANVLETSQQQQQQQQVRSPGMGVLQQQPEYSNNSSASTTHHLVGGPPDITTCCFSTNYDLLSSSPIAPAPRAPAPALFVDPHLRLSRHDDEADHDSRAPHMAFTANHIMR